MGINVQMSKMQGSNDIEIYLSNGLLGFEHDGYFIFEPSSSVFVKHFMSRNQEYESSNYSQDVHTAGYINTTTPITRIRFKFE